MSFTVLPQKTSTAKIQAAADDLLFDPFDYDETIPFYAATAEGTVGTSTLVLVEAPRRLTALTVGHIDLYISATGGNVDVGVFSFDGTTYTLLASSGSTAAGANGTRMTIALTSTVVRDPGVRWVYGVATSNGTVGIRRAATNVAALTIADNSAVFRSSSFPLASNAATFTTSGVSGSTLVPWLRGKA